MISRKKFDLNEANIGSYVFKISINPSKSHIAVSTSDAGVLVLSAKKLEPVMHLAQNSMAKDVKFLSDNLVQICNNKREISIWDILTNCDKPVACFSSDLPNEFVCCSGDISRNLIVGGTEYLNHSSYINFWDFRLPQDGVQFAFNEAHSEDITDIKFHPNYKNYLFSSSCDGLICGIDVNELPNQDDSIFCTLNCGNPISKFGFYGHHYSKLYAISDDEVLTTWSLDDNMDKISTFDGLRQEFSGESQRLEYLIDCSYDKKSDMLHLYGGDHSGNLHKLDVGSKQIRFNSSIAQAHSGTVRCVCPRKSEIITGSEDGSIVLWSCKTEKQARKGTKARFKPY